MKRLFYFSSIITLIFITACSKNNEDKMIGTWKQIPFYNPDSVEYINYWLFYAGGRLEVTSVFKNGTSVIDSSHTYDVNKNTFAILGPGDYVPDAGDIRGTYWIDELNKKFLKVTKREHPSDPNIYKPDSTSSSPYMRIEFVKQ